MKLTKAHERAKAKLTHEWQSANDVNERLATLDGLVARKGDERQFQDEGCGRWPLSPQSSIFYRLIGEERGN